MQLGKSHTSGAKCYKCSNCDINDLIPLMTILHNGKYDYTKSISEFTTMGEKVTIICPDHGEFKQCLNSHFNSGRGCPSCSESSGEKMIFSILTKNNIEFEREKSFDNCKYKSKLRFDFYLPKYNLLIEFNGIQHYEPRDQFGGKETYDIQIIKDNIKVEYCEKNNIQLLVIKYDQDILDTINKYIIF